MRWFSLLLLAGIVLLSGCHTRFDRHFSPSPEMVGVKLPEVERENVRVVRTSFYEMEKAKWMRDTNYVYVGESIYESKDKNEPDKYYAAAYGANIMIHNVRFSHSETYTYYDTIRTVSTTEKKVRGKKRNTKPKPPPPIQIFLKPVHEIFTCIQQHCSPKNRQVLLQPLHNAQLRLISENPQAQRL